ncbi:MAG: flagellar motor protein MotB [Phycisphaerae bacterium]|nr:flagellar motor protein MotB [Phycisphaerae bacterium]
MAEHAAHEEGHPKKKHSGGHRGGHGGGHEEAHEGAPEWLISFADMVMLMMGFFVIMFALNVQPKGGNAGGGGEQTEGVANQPDMIDFAISVRNAFHNPVDINSTDPNDAKLVERMREAGAGDSREDGTKGKERDVKSVRPSDYFGKGTAVSFALRSTMLDEDAGRTVAEFAAKHRGMKSVLDVRGHVSQTEAFRKPEEAMVLSSDRAMAVARTLAAAGIDWWRLRVIGCADHERIVANPAEDTDIRNARVEILVTDHVASPPTPVQPPTAAGDEGAAKSPQ